MKEPGCDSLTVSGLVTQQITGAERVTDVGAELSFILPSQSIAQFPALFDLLDSKEYIYIVHVHVHALLMFVFVALIVPTLHNYIDTCTCVHVYIFNTCSSVIFIHVTFDRSVYIMVTLCSFCFRKQDGIRC